MAETRQPLRYPTRDQIVELNRSHALASNTFHDGGNNLANESTLEWVLDSIQHSLFNQDIFPSIAEKAAALAWHIVTGHVFLDGNKRTGFSTMLIFLNLNGFGLDRTIDELEEQALTIANRLETGIQFSEFVTWVRDGLIFRDASS